MKNEAKQNLEQTAKGISEILKSDFLFKDATQNEIHAQAMRQQLENARGIIAKLFDAQN